MKRIFATLLLVCFYTLSYGQEINLDGFVLGSSKITAIGNVVKHPSKIEYRTKGDDWVEYHSSLVTYTLYFKDDKLVKVYKSDRHHNSNLFESFLQEIYIDLVYEYGDPIATGDSYAYWGNDKYKISFKYYVTSEPFQRLQTLEPTYDTFDTCTAITIHELR